MHSDSGLFYWPFHKLCQAIFLVLILCYYNIFCQVIYYNCLMPRPRKEKLPELNLSQSIGQNIARIRKSRGLTQIELGNIIGINQYQISDYEIGRLHLSDEMIIRFAKALKTTSDDILGLKESNNDVEKPSLKIIRRLIKIEKLSEADQKSLLKTIDMFLKAAEK